MTAVVHSFGFQVLDDLSEVCPACGVWREFTLMLRETGNRVFPSQPSILNKLVYEKTDDAGLCGVNGLVLDEHFDHSAHLLLELDNFVFNIHFVALLACDDVVARAGSGTPGACVCSLSGYQPGQCVNGAGYEREQRPRSAGRENKIHAGVVVFEARGKVRESHDQHHDHSVAGEHLNKSVEHEKSSVSNGSILRGFRHNHKFFAGGGFLLPLRGLPGRGLARESAPSINIGGQYGR
jgi:hypothetical protein